MRQIRTGWLLALSGVLHTTAQAVPATIRVDNDIQLSASQLAWELDGPFAMRHVELRLHNPHDRALEAMVTLPLAANERLRGYALDVDGQLRDAVPVERVKAKVAFEDTVRAQVDPALAQKGAGNSYSIRVFPIPAGGERRLRIDVASLGERERCGWQHRLEPALASMAELTASVVASARPAAGGGVSWKAHGGRFHAEWPMQRAAVRMVCLPAPTGDAAFSASFDDGLQMHWLEVPAAGATPAMRPLPTRVEVLWDASLSTQGVDRTAELEVLSRFLRGRRVELTLGVLRETVQTRRLTLASDTQVDQLLTTLLDERPDGATGLASWHADPQAEAVLLFGDAVTTLPGDVGAPQTPVFLIAQRIGDPAMARWLARAGGQVLDLSALTLQQVLARLQQTPALQVRQGPLDRQWHVENQGVGGGALRACHIGNQPSAIPALTVLHAAGTAAPVPRVHKAIPARAADMVAFWCANWQVESLDAQPEKHRAELAALGERFGVVNRETSLLVLERDEDYVRHGILPPAVDAALRDRVLQQRFREQIQRDEAAQANDKAINDGWQARVAWWNTAFPKDDPRPRWERERREAERQQQREHRDGVQMPTAVPPPPPAPGAPLFMLEAASVDEPDTAQAAIAIGLQTVRTDAPYVADLLAEQTPASLYLRYFDLRSRYGQSPAFHFDVAQRLFELGDAVLAWRVLSNLVELLPQDVAALRLVAYRLQDAGLHAEAEALLRQVRALAPDEPQSFRDLALALQAPASCQEALELLAHVVETPWPQRFADIGLIALAEHNDLGTRCPGARTGSLSPALQQPLPVGLRVTLRWDLDDTDIDLHVTDPNGETVYYAHRSSYQGGRISRDFTAGYGPEEFILRDPKPGRYTVEVNYYGSRLARLSRGAGVNVSLQTGFGTPNMQQQSLSLRLLEQSGKVGIGGFTVTARGQLEVAGKGAQ